jgi:lysophospholipase L1-like esterase
MAALVGSLAVLAAACLLAPSASASAPYYVALGDSLSTGGGATPGHGYVYDVVGWARARVPGLQLENLGCGGDSTTRMIEGGLCTKYTTGDQLGDAEAFLSAHPGEVKFVTIDVGGDDIVGCAGTGKINPICVKRGLENVEHNMPVILEGLRSAGGANLPIVGMTYYDPILGDYVRSAEGETTARESIAILKSLNKELTSAYHRFHVKFATIDKTFQSTDWNLSGSYEGKTLPQNVADICNWTHMCEAEPNIHTNDSGHELIAARYEKLLKKAVK